MGKPRHRFWLPLLLALICGAGAWWGVGEWLRPKPLWEKPLDEGQSVSVHLDHIVIDTHNQLILESTQRVLDYYEAGSGRKSSQFIHQRNSQPQVNDDPQYNSRLLPEDANRYSLSHFQGTTHLLDLQTGKRYPFHGFVPNENGDNVSFAHAVPTQSAVISRPLPIALVGVAMQTLGSPAFNCCQAHLAMEPGNCPTLLNVVTVPGKKTLGQLVLPSLNGRPLLIPSETGKYVAVINVYNSEIINSEESARRLIGIWNVGENRWMRLLNFPADVISYAYFLGDDYLIVRESDSSTNHVIWHIPKGTEVAQLKLQSTNFPYQNLLQRGKGCFFTRPGEDPTILELCNHHPEEGFQIHYRWQLATTSYSSTELFQGLQTTRYSLGSGDLPDIVKKNLPDSWLSKLQSWLQAPTLQIYDWSTSRLYSLFNSAYAYSCKNGQYMVIYHYTPNSQAARNRSTKLQVYQMPLTLHSAWWHRGVGLTVFILVFTICRWSLFRLQRRD